MLTSAYDESRTACRLVGQLLLVPYMSENSCSELVTTLLHSARWRLQSQVDNSQEGFCGAILSYAHDVASL